MPRNQSHGGGESLGKTMLTMVIGGGGKSSISQSRHRARSSLMMS